ncbi:hypothetical protein HK101_000161 [Irineochytrium annulatum]|nr:hypothetical protein HK101_000161 [Irineochytrium annulatum]
MPLSKLVESAGASTSAFADSPVPTAASLIGCNVPHLPPEIHLRILSHIPAPSLPPLLSISRSLHPYVSHALLLSLPPHLNVLRARLAGLARRLEVGRKGLKGLVERADAMPTGKDVDEIRRYGRPRRVVVDVMASASGSNPLSAAAAPRVSGSVSAPALDDIPANSHLSVWRSIQSVMSQPTFKPWLRSLVRRSLYPITSSFSSDAESAEDARFASLTLYLATVPSPNINACLASRISSTSRPLSRFLNLFMALSFLHTRVYPLEREVASLKAEVEKAEKVLRRLGGERFERVATACAADEGGEGAWGALRRLSGCGR